MIQFDATKHPNIICEKEYEDLPLVHLEFSPLGRDDWQSFPVVLSTESTHSTFAEVFADSLGISIGKCDEDFFNGTSYRVFPVTCRLPNMENVVLMAHVNHSEKMNKASCRDLTAKVGIILDSYKIFFFNYLNGRL